jgi:signal transduction histidine kinase/ActR/RegA family two-component response regulator
MSLLPAPLSMFAWLRILALFGWLMWTGTAVTLAATIAVDTQAERMDLSGSMSLLHDPTGKLHYTEVLTQGNEFRRVQRQDLIQGFNAGVFWLRFSLVHAGAQPVTRWLVVGTPKINAVTLYLQRGEHWQAMQSGRNVALAQKPIVATDAAFPITLTPGENREILIRVVARGATDMSTTLWEPQAYRFAAGERKLWTVAMLAGVLVSSGLAMIVLIRLRQTQYLWLGLFLLGIAGVEAARENLIGLYLWPNDRAVPLQVLSLFGGLAIFSLAKVIAAALELQRQMPRADRLLLAMRWLGVAAAILTLFDYGIGVRVLAIAAVLVHLAGLVLPVVLWRCGFQPARWFAVAFSLGLLIETARQLANLGILPWAGAMNFSLAGYLLAAPFILVGMIEQTRKMSEKLAVAEHLQQAKSAFLARVSHELRSPLNTILGFARMLGRGSTRLSMQEGTAGIEKGALRLLGLIDELLDESRAAAGKLAVSPEPTLFNLWLDEVCAGATIACEAQGNRFSCQRSSELPVAISADGQRLRQVLENLLNNANRHTHQGEIQLECAGKIEDSMVTLRFAVRDTGEGMTPEQQKLIFEPFVRGSESSSRDRRHGGFGLGLPISRELVRQMGSEIAVSSTPGKGSCFSFTLRCPLVAAPTAELCPPVVAPMRLPVAASGYTDSTTREIRPRLLLVDDDPQQLQLLSDLLDDSGFVTQEVNSGQAAAEQLGKGHWDAIVTDQMMTNGDGWFLLRQVRESDHAVPVVMLSAAPPQRPADFPTDIKFDAMLSKPALSEDLLATIWALVLKVGAGETAISTAQWQTHWRTLATLAGDGDVSGIEDWIAVLPTSPVTEWARAALNRLDFDLMQRSAIILSCTK